jgi:uncharacterized SAM-binding protein YcdF (DUF218 family)
MCLYIGFRLPDRNSPVSGSAYKLVAHNRHMQRSLVYFQQLHGISQHWTFLGIDVLNLIVLALLIQILPPSLGLALNVVVLLAIFLLLYVKSTFYEK